MKINVVKFQYSYTFCLVTGDDWWQDILKWVGYVFIDFHYVYSKRKRSFSNSNKRIETIMTFLATYCIQHDIVLLKVIEEKTFTSNIRLKYWNTKILGWASIRKHDAQRFLLSNRLCSALNESLIIKLFLQKCPQYYNKNTFNFFILNLPC